MGISIGGISPITSANRAAGIPDVAFLDARSPLHKEYDPVWQILERRFRGGHKMVGELYKFRHELKTDSPSFARRAATFVYQKFPEMFASITVGHTFTQAPTFGSGLDFGSLGAVRRTTELRGERTRAELLNYNANGVGNDGSQWAQFWASEARLAMATGHRWMMTEAPYIQPGRQLTVRDELAGARPYLVPYSPRAVQDHEYEGGQLQYANVRVRQRVVQATGDGQGYSDSGTASGHYLLVRQGFKGFGAFFEKGGWWRFDPDKKIMQRSDGSILAGDWSRTGGEIPFSPLFWQRDTGTEDDPAMSQSAIYELSQLAVADMNMESAADHDAWTAAMSLIFLLGVDASSFNTATEKMDEGSLAIPVPANPATGQTPAVYDSSSGAVAADVFLSRATARAEKFRQLTSLMATSEPGSSGVSKAIGFAEAQGPRLALLASELAQCQNAHLRWCEMRWGTAGPGSPDNREPSAVTEWGSQYNLSSYADQLRQMLELMELAKASSPTFLAPALVAAGKKMGLMADDKTADAIEDELHESIVAANRAQNIDAQNLGGGGGGGGDGGSGGGEGGGGGPGVGGGDAGGGASGEGAA